MTGCIIDFTTPPAPGAAVVYYRGMTLTLIQAVPHARRDGTPSHLLEWRADDGRTCVSGLRAKTVRWDTTIEEVVQCSAEARARRASGDEPPTPARPPRPEKPPAPPKARLSLRLDADLAARLREQGDMTAFASAAIRAALDRQAAADGSGQA